MNPRSLAPAVVVLALLVPRAQAQEEPAGEVRLKAAVLDPVSLFAHLRGFAMSRGDGVEVVYSQEEEVVTLRGPGPELAVMRRFAEVLDGPRAPIAGDRRELADVLRAQPVELGDGLFARRMDALEPEEASEAFAQARAIIVMEVEGARRCQVFGADRRVVVIGPRANVQLVAAAVEALLGALARRRPPPLPADPRAGVLELAARFVAAGDAAHGRAFGGHTVKPGPLGEARFHEAVAAGCVEAIASYRHALATWALLGADEGPADERERVAERVARLPRNARSACADAAAAYEKAGDAEGARRVRALAPPE